MPIIPQTLNINNLRTTNVKSIKLNTIRKDIIRFRKGSCKGNVYFHRFRDIAIRR